MNPSTALARVLVDELVRHGVREAVLAPGSRSAPLAYALHAADAAGLLRLHVRVDERSAGFLALGLAKGSHRPVPVVTTSGTAVANLHPAVLEAHHANVPLVVLSADRPAELRGTGANQVTDQVKVFGGAVEAFVELPAPDVVPDTSGRWRATLSRALHATARGPVHVNVCLRDPLVPDDDGGLPAALDGRPGGAAWSLDLREETHERVTLPLGPRTVVVAGDDAGPPARQLAERAGWPLLAEPSSGSRTGTAPIGTYRLLLGLPELADAVERVVVLGHPTLSRPVTRLLSRADVEVVAVGTGTRPDPGSQVSRVLGAVGVDGPDDPAWRDRWTVADVATRAAMDDVLAAEPSIAPQQLAHEVSAALRPGGLLVVGSSSPVRDLDLTAVSHPVGERRMVMANRGLAGIDGMLSTAIGVALARRSTHALAYVGDLTFLHDTNGLLIGPDEPRPDLRVVVASDDGGSIFAGLEHGAPSRSATFERLFATPTGTDLGAWCAAARVPHERITDLGRLRDVLASPCHGLEVVEVPLDRTRRRDLDARLAACARLA
ncbi:2-succinyl-5-enolpyruvyl-6-hydroxy-3-cyclohexene-1-carboxylic-acid synthase [Solicola sp. PLA-1-18]|uniref:2-succinyl-5-enolpyruvyl-6-hydroxy-3- cyclohexene-1-carboxylic-acid synthase n=1 Tax=Solicola sp. PLA-1-18 TaxID=3380532 RepID=UPI003B7F17A7